MADTLRYVYKVVDDCVIGTDVHLPAPVSQEPTAYPVLFMIHGGAFVLGSSKMVSADQITDCTERGWIVLALDHRLCPQVKLLEGPMQDCRDALKWVQSGGLDKELAKDPKTAMYKADQDKIVAYGTSAGGHLALSMGFDVEKPVLAILDFYAPKVFNDPFWTSTIPSLERMLPKDLTPEFLNKVYDEKPVPIEGGVSLEGQATKGPNFSDPRQAFAFVNMAYGTLMRTIHPFDDGYKPVDPYLNVSSSFPPTFVVHGGADEMIIPQMSRLFVEKMREVGATCEMIEIAGQPHSFVGRMQKGDETWNQQRKGFDWLQSIIEKGVPAQK
ncbi:Alpha/Beta hydrolase protein [Myxozyma melibiosi]|uniref:Alpha/Beta hydrolase protein n=1 Tax=Myxozyma melibiosi TaxID=54550 RepID=A0ABR1EXY5_9ASCO